MSVPYTPVAITSAVRTTTTLTCLVPSTADLRTGDVLNIYGWKQENYNKLTTITVVDGTHFSYPVTNTGTTPATGTAFYQKTSGINAPYVANLGNQPGIQNFEEHQYPNTGDTVTPQNSAVMFTRPATLASFYGLSTAGSQRWAMLFDATSVPADGAIPFRQVAVGAGTGQGDNFYLDVPPDGIRFQYGIVAAMSTTPDVLAITTDEAATFNGDWHV